jgi:hypothetical protein
MADADQAPDDLDELPEVSWADAFKAGPVRGDRIRTHATTTAESALSPRDGRIAPDVPSHGRGRGFKSPIAHQSKTQVRDDF